MLQCVVVLTELSGMFFKAGWVDMDKNRVLAEKKDIEFGSDRILNKYEVFRAESVVADSALNEKEKRECCVAGPQDF